MPAHRRHLLLGCLAAGLLLVREAGGIVSDLDGGSNMLAKGSVLAANGAIHKALLPLVSAGAAG